MSTKFTNIILFAIIGAAFLLSAIVFPLFPDTIASHWNIDGQADGYMSRFWGVFLMPMILVLLYVFYIIIPKIDPLKKNIASFRKYYNAFWVVLFLFFLYVLGLTLIWNLGIRFDFSVAIIPAISLLMIVIGEILKKTKRNWFMGIRTPWTLSSDVVWNKTHAIGGKLFQLTGLISLLSVWYPKLFLVFLMVPLFASVIFLLVYSYVLHSKLKK